EGIFVITGSVISALNDDSKWYVELVQRRRGTQFDALRETTRHLRSWLDTLDGIERIRQRLVTLELRSLTDHRTGLFNAVAFAKIAAIECSHASAHRPLSLLYIDLNNLKKINDSVGHQSGDKLIRRTASVLQKNAERT